MQVEQKGLISELKAISQRSQKPVSNQEKSKILKRLQDLRLRASQNPYLNDNMQRHINNLIEHIKHNLDQSPA